MSTKLTKGTSINSIYGVDITIQEHLGEGGQGDVYKVNYGGELKALKWYKKNALGDDPEVLRKLINQNIDAKSPSNEFLWPFDLTDYKDGTFGYIMDLRPDGFHEISEFMLRQAKFGSFKTVIDASLNIVKAFRVLHNTGYSYQDMNDGNFFINPKNGKVWICDNDNVAPEGTPTRILGKPGYMAPEVVTGKNKPNKYSDRFSLSVILFILLCLNHPLAGKRVTNEAVLTNALEKKLYGEEPLFIMDKDDTSNSPDPRIHKNVLGIWSYLPNYIQDIFYRSFSQEALHNPLKRPEEFEWIEALVRFRSEIISCSCGNENFSNNGVIPKCDNCGIQHKSKTIFQFENYNLPAIAGTRIFRCQLGTCNPADVLNPAGNVISNPKNPDEIGIKNLDSVSWIGTATTGAKKEVKSGEIIPIKPGIVINTGKSEIKILEI